MSYEDAILNRQESETDECKTCEFLGVCTGQCNEVKEIWNPNLEKWRHLITKER